MEALQIGTRREVCWDDALMDDNHGVQIVMHRPEYRGKVFCADAPWEGNTTGYFEVLRESNGLRLYYRGCNIDVSDSMEEQTHAPTFCLCSSKDGKYFERVPVNQNTFEGISQNNIVFDKTDDNFVIFRDTNPDCPKDERFKALSGTNGFKLNYYKSADGIRFEFARVLDDDGMYDSMNVAFWDAQAKLYRLYYRGLHDEHGNDFRWGRGQKGTPIRDIRMKTSPDFVVWSEGHMLDYGKDAPDPEMYTNQVQPYYRAPHMLLGIPTRYNDRVKDVHSLSALPDAEHRMRIIEKWGRSGTAMTDCCLMTSRDGLHFRRANEAFITPGAERTRNWYYGDCYTALGMAETTADRAGCPNEISLYMGENYRAASVELARYALRLDGFFSWHGDFSSAYVLTKPLVFSGNALRVNFATSALGHVRVTICTESGEPIEGYATEHVFGDSVERRVYFEKPLADLNGVPVRLKIELKDADLYSFRFCKELL